MREKFPILCSRVFRADHNSLTELPYDFSQLLQNYDTKNVTLGHNRWQCSCNAEIADTVSRSIIHMETCKSQLMQQYLG